MSPLRILHVVPYYEQAWAYGGIPRLATTMTQALARRGHRVVVCTTDARDQASRALPGPARTAGAALPDVRIFPNISNRLAYHWQFFTPVGLGRYLRDAAVNLDVAHLHACHNLPGVIAARELGRAGVPYVLSPNGTAAPIERRILAKRVFAATIGRHVVAGAARVLAVSQAERRQLLAMGIPAAHVDVVPNPLDLDEYEPAAEPRRFRAAHDLGDGRLVLFLGKLTPRKGCDVLLRAFAQLTDRSATLVIAGNDMGAGALLDALTAQLGLAGRVIRTGLLRGQDRLDALAAADVVVYPSRDEIFGLVPLEALLCGSPVIVSDDSGCGEIIRQVGGGLVIPYGDAAALAASIAAILASPAAWAEEAGGAAGRIRARFGAATVCGQLEQVYADAIAAASGPSRMRA